MSGISRVKIVSQWSCSNDAYLRINSACEESANKLYQAIFKELSMPLIDSNVEIISCTKDEAVSRYDWQQGIDVILQFSDGTKSTMQEKYLTWHQSTLTVETSKSSGADGAWKYCTAQYYFIGYARRLKEFGDSSFQDWILVDWPALQRADRMQLLKWQENQCHNNNRRSQFKWIHFDGIPANCVISRHPLKNEKRSAEYEAQDVFADF